jgi:hypothetical protein
MPADVAQAGGKIAGAPKLTLTDFTIQSTLQPRRTIPGAYLWSSGAGRVTVVDRTGR